MWSDDLLTTCLALHGIAGRMQVKSILLLAGAIAGVLTHRVFSRLLGIYNDYLPLHGDGYGESFGFILYMDSQLLENFLKPE